MAVFFFRSVLLRLLQGSAARAAKEPTAHLHVRKWAVSIIYSRSNYEFAARESLQIAVMLLDGAVNACLTACAPFACILAGARRVPFFFFWLSPPPSRGTHGWENKKGGKAMLLNA